MAEKGFVMLKRIGGIELLENDPQAFLLLTHIALRARRRELLFSRHPLKPNQAFIGDYEKIGLTRQQYRDAQVRLAEYNLVTFEPTNKGTIATLTSTDIYDINVEKEYEEPTDLSMKTEPKEPTKNQIRTFNKPSDNQSKTIEAPSENYQSTNHEPLTNNEIMENNEIMKDGNNATSTTTQLGVDVLYPCLQTFKGTKGFELTYDNKQSLMSFPQDRVIKAIEYALHPLVKIKKDLISLLHWHCKQDHPPMPQDVLGTIQANLTPQQSLAFKYNQFLEERGYFEEAEKNKLTIPGGYAHILMENGWTTVALNNPIALLRQDFETSMMIHNNKNGNLTIGQK